MTSDFAHLHLHTQYSLLDGAIRMEDLCPTVLERGMKSVAVTDHGNMFGAVQFYKTAKAHGVNPIFGCEAYIADGDAEVKKDRKNYHIVLLAKNQIGFQNLQRLVSYGHLQGFYYNPRIDRKTLRKHSEGLVGLSACMSGHISRLVTAGDMDAARSMVREYADIFEPGSYFLELQPNGMKVQETINASLAQLGKDLDVPLVATNDCHYVDRGEAYAHEVLMCMGMGRTMSDQRRVRHDCDEFFIKTPEQMWGYFSQYPEAMEGTTRIAGMCNFDLQLGKTELPDFRLPDNEHSEADYLAKLAREGLRRRIREAKELGRRLDEDHYSERLERELSIIIDMKFPGYFLIVWDFIDFAKKRGIPVGPGRGSGAGSLVAYSLRITDIDPIQYNLLFERFLNPERVSMPDFDIDLCQERRDEVIRYVSQRYGEEKVGQIATFHSLRARGLLRDVCRAMDKGPSEATEYAKLVPEGLPLSMCLVSPDTIRDEIKKRPEKASKLEKFLKASEAATKLRLRIEKDEDFKRIMGIGVALEGLNRHAGMHAAGLVIGNRPLVEHVPCFKSDDKIVTQYTMEDVEEAGLVKFDLLGLKTLTVIHHAVDLINDLPPRFRVDPVARDLGHFEIERIPMDDASVYNMLSRGETSGVFQMESSGFRKLLQKLKPDVFEDIVAAVALYRPGPLEGGMLDQFIDCKHGRRAIEYPHPLLEKILRNTYGVFVYQEQVMQAGEALAGFTTGGADIMRRAMGKKKPKEMEEQRQKFVDGCVQVNNIAKDHASHIFDLIDKFSGYGFNRSHSAAYGLIGYQTAYLSHYYPECFMAALMTCDRHKIESIAKLVGQARAIGLDVLPPDINQSKAVFGVTSGEASMAIRFGLGAISGVGDAAARSIVAIRQADGPFASVFDLCRRVNPQQVTKKTVENLVYAGALESASEGRDRATVLAAIPAALKQGKSAHRDRISGQIGLFGDLSQISADTYPEAKCWGLKEELLLERQALGFYLTSHPLVEYKAQIDHHASLSSVVELQPEHEGYELTLAGVITDLKEITTRKGQQMGFFRLEDQLGRLEVVVFPREWSSSVGDVCLGEWLASHVDEPILVTGTIQIEYDEDGHPSRYKIFPDLIQALSDVHVPSLRLRIQVGIDDLDEDLIVDLHTAILENPGDSPVRMEVISQERYRADVSFGPQFSVDTKAALPRIASLLQSTGLVTIEKV